MKKWIVVIVSLHLAAVVSAQERIRKHHVSQNYMVGAGRYPGYHNPTWDQDYFGISFEYAFRRGNTEVGTGLVLSNIAFSIPFTAKKYLGEYIFLGIGVMPGFSPKTGFCVGAGVMAGIEYVFGVGIALSLAPHLRYNILNITGGKDEYAGAEILQQAGVSIGVGYRF